MGGLMGGAINGTIASLNGRSFWNGVMQNPQPAPLPMPNTPSPELKLPNNGRSEVQAMPAERINQSPNPANSLAKGRSEIKQWLENVNSGNIDKTQAIKDLKGAGFQQLSPDDAPSMHLKRGDIKIRMDLPDKYTPDHMHINYKIRENAYDINLNGVNFKSKPAHIEIKK
jgi:hypothetical protein